MYIYIYKYINNYDYIPITYETTSKKHQDTHLNAAYFSLALPQVVGLGGPDPQLIQESKFDRNNGLVVMHQLQTGSKSSSRGKRENPHVWYIYLPTFGWLIFFGTYR